MEGCRMSIFTSSRRGADNGQCKRSTEEHSSRGVVGDLELRAQLHDGNKKAIKTQHRAINWECVLLYSCVLIVALFFHIAVPIKERHDSLNKHLSPKTFH
jgi:hypothetical protein